MYIRVPNERVSGIVVFFIRSAKYIRRDGVIENAYHITRLYTCAGEAESPIPGIEQSMISREAQHSREDRDWILPITETLNDIFFLV